MGHSRALIQINSHITIAVALRTLSPGADKSTGNQTVRVLV